MSEQPTEASSRAEEADLLARCLAARESEGDSAVERLCAEHPSLSEAVQRKLNALASHGLLDQHVATTQTAARRLGQFELLKMIGRGGMGEVHLARQDGLDRNVALKLVRPEHLHFKGARERFQREADAIAQLKHPGIVPVYAVGEEEGVPYIAMEFVEGATLEDVLTFVAGRDPSSLSGLDLQRCVQRSIERTDDVRSGSLAQPSGGTNRESSLFTGSWVEAVLRIGLGVTDALQHAHNQGVLHRDVKPSNLMVTSSGRVVLLDFGLALLEGEQRLTRTGAVVGSLAYMPPEQIQGDEQQLDGRIDVYSVGATLYELLTLRTPFSETTQEALRQAILNGSVPSVREANPSVGADAATLVQVALSPRRDDRYATAAAMGADLQRVLERRPLLARPPTAMVRTWRWVQRRPALACSIALFTLLLVGGPLSYGFLADQHSREMSREAQQSERSATLARLASERANAEANAATAARSETEAHFKLARQAVSELLVDVTWNDLFRQANLLPVRLGLLEKALLFYDSLSTARPADAELRLARLQVLYDIAFTHQLSGQIEPALAAFHTLVEDVVAEKLAATSTPLTEAQNEHLWLMHYEGAIGLTVISELRGSLSDSRQRQIEATDILRQRLDMFPHDASLMTEFGRLTASRARTAGLSGQHEESEALFMEALEILDRAIEQSPAKLKPLNRRLEAGREWTTQLFNTGRWSDCVSAGLATLAVFEKLSALAPVDLHDRYSRLVLWQTVADALIHFGALEEAERLLDAANHESVRLLEEHPDYFQLTIVRAITLSALSRLDAARGEFHQALAHLAEVQELTTESLLRWPGDIELRLARVITFTDQSRILRARLGLLDQAHASMLAGIEELLPLQPLVETARWNQAASILWHSISLVELDRRQHASSVQAAEAWAAVDPAAPWETLQRAALLVVRNLPFVAEDDKLSTEQRTTTQSDYIDRTFQLLLKAESRGMDSTEALTANTLWSPLWDDPRLTALQQRLSEL